MENKIIDSKTQLSNELDAYLLGKLALSGLVQSQMIIGESQRQHYKSIEDTITKVLLNETSVLFQEMLIQELPQNTPRTDTNSCRTFFEYLVSTISSCLTKSDVYEPHFAFPGTPEEGKELAIKFKIDFGRIEEQLGITYYELPSVKYGYAINFIR